MPCSLMSSMIKIVHVYYTSWPTLLYQEHTEIATLTQRAYNGGSSYKWFFFRDNTIRSSTKFCSVHGKLRSVSFGFLHIPWLHTQLMSYLPRYLVADHHNWVFHPDIQLHPDMQLHSSWYATSLSSPSWYASPLILICNSTEHGYFSGYLGERTCTGAV